MAIGRTFFLFVQGLQHGEFTLARVSHQVAHILMQATHNCIGYFAFWKSGNCVQATIRHWFHSAILYARLLHAF
jgi:hypothetical protein